MSERGSVESYLDWEVWKRGIVLMERVYAVTDSFPDQEQYELTSQLRRAVVSVPSNIAEGWGYSSRKQYVHCLEQARSLRLEVETQITIGERLGCISQEERAELIDQMTIESKMLPSLMRSLQS